MQTKLLKAPKDIRRCDPKKHEKHETYERLTHFLQGWIASEEYLNKAHSCGGDCPFKITRFYRMENDPDDIVRFHDELVSKGLLYNCTFMNRLNRIYRQIKPPDSERLYHHLTRVTQKYGKEVVHTWGKIDFPEYHKLKNYTNDDVRHGSISFWSICDICLCYIDHEIKPYAIRKISIIPVTASIGSVVTGVRLAIFKQTIYIQIQEGTFENGAINPSTVKWHRRTTDNISKWEYLTYDRRSVYLDDVIVTPGSFVTGVRFLSKDDKIYLSVLERKFNQQGLFSLDDEHWIDANIEEPREEIILNNPDVSELAPHENEHVIINTSGKHFIKFQPTDIEKDAAQTTVPYLDIQEVFTNPPAPVNGIGLYYKAMDGYGGYLSLKLVSANFLTTKIDFKNIEQEFNKLDIITEYYQHKKIE